ncbi:MAG: hypothetical protein RR740_00540 [Pseudomonas sp.]
MTWQQIVMTGVGYLVLVGLTLFVAQQAWGATRLCLAFRGKLCIETYILAIITAILAFLCYWLFPFEVTMSMLPVSTK